MYQVKYINNKIRPLRDQSPERRAEQSMYLPKQVQY